MQVILHEGESAKQFVAKIAEEVALIVLDQLEERIQEMATVEKPDENEFVGTKEAMEILGIRSNKKMQQIRDERDSNGIEISINGRKFRYRKSTLIAYLNNSIK